jgi:outer membrane protein TolC
MQSTGCPRKSPVPVPGWCVSLLMLGAAGLLLAGCSADHYRKSADREVYHMIQVLEDGIFGRTNDFTIDTRYSQRHPELVLPAELVEDRTATNRRTLDLESTLNLAVQNSREYQGEKERLYLTALSLTGTRHQFTPRFLNSSVAATANGDGEGRLTGRLRPDFTVGQALMSGGDLSVSLANDLLAYYTGSGLNMMRGEAINFFSVNLAQPLLRGAGRYSPAVENLTQSQRDVIYAVRSFNQFQREFAINIVNEYFGLLDRKVQVRNFYTNYLRRVELTEYFEARAVDRASATQVEDQRSAELSARISYITAVATYQDQLDAFKIRLGLPISETLYLSDAELEAVEAAGPIPVDVTREAAFALAVERHMDILNAIDQFEDSKRRIWVRADQLRPGLNFTARGTATSEPNYTEFDVRNFNYAFGLSLDLPFNRMRERNDYRATLVSFESQLRSLSLTLDRFKQRIDGGLRALEAARLNIINQQAQLTIEERRVELNTIRLQAGRVQIRDVREAQDALISAQNALTARIVAYLRARLLLLLDIGVVQTDLERFWLHDPLEGLLDESQRGAEPLQMPRETLIPPNIFLDPGT